MTVLPSLYVFGAGGHGRSVADVASCCGYGDIVFVDSRWPELSSNSDWKVVAKDGSSIPAGSRVFVAIGDSNERLAMFRQMTDGGFEIPTLVHPSAYLSKRATIGVGCVVMPQSVVGVGSAIGAAVIVNTSASIDHDCSVGDGAHISPGAHLAGGVHVGQESWIGIGAMVREGVRIGSRVMIGAGAVVVSDVPDGARMIGVPAREMK